jgi:hypothetical protein
MDIHILKLFLTDQTCLDFGKGTTQPTPRFSAIILSNTILRDYPGDIVYTNYQIIAQISVLRKSICETTEIQSKNALKVGKIELEL